MAKVAANLSKFKELLARKRALGVGVPSSSSTEHPSTELVSPPPAYTPGAPLLPATFIAGEDANNLGGFRDPPTRVKPTEPEEPTSIGTPERPRQAARLVNTTVPPLKKVVYELEEGECVDDGAKQYLTIKHQSPPPTPAPPPAHNNRTSATSSAEDSNILFLADNEDETMSEVQRVNYTIEREATGQEEQYEVEFIQEQPPPPPHHHQDQRPGEPEESTDVVIIEPPEAGEQVPDAASMEMGTEGGGGGVGNAAKENAPKHAFPTYYNNSALEAQYSHNKAAKTDQTNNNPADLGNNTFGKTRRLQIFMDKLSTSADWLRLRIEDMQAALTLDNQRHNEIETELEAIMAKLERLRNEKERISLQKARHEWGIQRLQQRSHDRKSLIYLMLEKFQYLPGFLDYDISNKEIIPLSAEEEADTWCMGWNLMVEKDCPGVSCVARHQCIICSSGSHPMLYCPSASSYVLPDDEEGNSRQETRRLDTVICENWNSNRLCEAGPNCTMLHQCRLCQGKHREVECRHFSQRGGFAPNGQHPSSETSGLIPKKRRLV